MNYDQRHQIERDIVLFLIRTMRKRGWVPIHVDDGGGDWLDVGTDDEVMDAVFAVDEAQICFQKERAHWVKIILGNDGYDCIADYSYSMGDDFDLIMSNEVNPYCDSIEHGLLPNFLHWNGNSQDVAVLTVNTEEEMKKVVAHLVTLSCWFDVTPMGNQYDIRVKGDVAHIAFKEA